MVAGVPKILPFCVDIVAAFANGFAAVVSVKPPPNVLAVDEPIDKPPKPNPLALVG